VSKFCILLYWQHYCMTLAVGVSETLVRRTRNGITELSQRAPPIFGWAAITLGIGPHSSCEKQLVQMFWVARLQFWYQQENQLLYLILSLSPMWPCGGCFCVSCSILLLQLSRRSLWSDTHPTTTFRNFVVIGIDREFVTSAKKIVNFNEFSEIKKKIF